MTEVHRTNLEWARDVARAYRSALRVADPTKCAELDDMARKRGQRWVAPTYLPAAAAEHGQDAVLPAKDIQQFWGVPAATIWAWSSKGLLPNHGRPRAPRFKVSEVLAVEARHRKKSA